MIVCVEHEIFSPLQIVRHETCEVGRLDEVMSRWPFEDVVLLPWSLFN